MEPKDLSVIIPAYKEAENLKIILPQLVAVIRELGQAEVLVIDTVEPLDETAQVCEANAVNYYNRRDGNNYGDAIRTGIAQATGKYTIFMDADGSHDPNFIKALYGYRADFDIVIASRYVNGGDTDNSRLLIFMSLAVNYIYGLVLNIKCQDISNSFKLYQTADLKQLSLKCNNFDIVEEIIYKLKKQKGVLKIKELPFLFKKRMFGDTKRNLLQFILTYIVTLYKLRFDK